MWWKWHSGISKKMGRFFLPFIWRFLLWGHFFSSAFSHHAVRRSSHMKSEVESEVAQSCLSLCNPMDCSLLGSSVHGIFPARLLEWVAISFSRGSSQPRDQTQVSCIAGRCFTIWATREAPNHMREGKRGWVPRQQSTWMQAIWVSHLGIFSFILHWNIVDLHYCVSFRSCEGAILDIAAQLTSQRAE